MLDLGKKHVRKADSGPLLSVGRCGVCKEHTDKDQGKNEIKAGGSDGQYKKTRPMRDHLHILNFRICTLALPWFRKSTRQSDV